MNNTKLIFYWTSFEYGQFHKTVFEVILEGSPFENDSDAKEWIDENCNKIFNEFNFSCVFDHVLVGFSSTDESVKNVTIIETKVGTLSFKTQKPKVSKKPKTEKPAKKVYPSVWIDPSGKTYNVGFAEHESWASEWLIKNDPNWKKSKQFDIRYAYEELEKRGWARILGWSDPPSFSLPSVIGGFLKRSIKNYCHNNGVRYPDEIQDY